VLKLTDRLLDWFCARIPDPPKNPRGGRPRTDKHKALAGIFRLLDHGVQWKDLPRQFGTKSAGHRFFQRLVREGVFERLLQEAGQLVEERGSIDCMNAFRMRRFVRHVVEATGSGARRWARG